MGMKRRAMRLDEAAEGVLVACAQLEATSWAHDFVSTTVRPEAAAARLSLAPRARAEGHQTHSPMSSTSARTSRDRTRNVSIRTPIAIVKPISVSATSGSTASVEKVPASTSPAEVITAPGHGEAPDRPGARAAREGLLAHARHEEDVVVDAQRDQEDEREQRQVGRHPGEVEDVLEEERPDAERGEVGDDHRPRSAPAAP